MPTAAHLARRFLALILSIPALVAMLVFTGEPLVWEWMGRPDESYPEVVFMIYGIPAGTVAFMTGFGIALAVRPSGGFSWPLLLLRVVYVLSMGVCAWLCWFALTAFLHRA